MKRWCALLFLLTGSMMAQTSAVTATITDPDGQTWNNGTYTITLIPAPNSPGPPTWTGGTLTRQFTGTMSGSGVLTQSVADTSTISAPGALWQFTLCPNSTAPCQNVRTAVTGGSPNLSTTLSNGLIAPRFNAGQFAYGYLDVEVNTPVTTGSVYYNVTNSVQRIWTGSAWVNGSGTGAGTVAGVGITTGVKGQGVVANGTANTLAPTSAAIDITPFLPAAPSAGTDLCPYIFSATTLNPFAVIDLRGLPVRTYCNFPMVNPANGQTSTITSVATSSGGSAVYTGTFPFGANNFYANPGCSIAAVSAQTAAFCKVVITAFVGGNNNGTFTISASTTTTITVNNPSATTESAAATGVIGGGGNFSGKVLAGFTAFFVNSYAGYQSFGSGNNLEGEGRVNSAGGIPYVPGTGTDFELCNSVSTEMAASDFTNVCGSVAMQTAIVSTDTNNYPAIISMNSYPATSGAVGVSGTTALAARISGISVGCGMLANTTAFGNYNAQEGSKFDNNYVHDCSSTADIGFDLGGGTGGAQNFWLTDFQVNTLSGKTNVASAVGIRVWTATGNGVPSIIEKGSVVNNSAVGTSPNYDFEYVGGTTGIGSLVMLGNHWESAGVAGLAIGVATVKGVDQGGAVNGLIAIGQTCGPGFGSGAGSGCFVIFNGTIGTGTAAATNISILSSLATGAGGAPLNLITDQNNTSIAVATKFISRYETDGSKAVIADTSKTNASQLFTSAHNISTPLICAPSGGSGTAYTCTTSPSFTPVDGDIVLMQPDVASGIAATLSVNGAAAAPIKTVGNIATVANTLVVGGDCLMQFDAVNWQMQCEQGSPLTVAFGGTGLNSCTTNGLVFGNATNPLTCSSTITSTGGVFVKYNNVTTVGTGVPAIYGVDNVTGSSATRTTQNILASTPAAGEYIVNWYIDQNAPCTTVPGSVTIAINWTDATAARASGTIGTLTFTTSGASTTAFAQGTFTLWAATATAITDTDTYVACGTGTSTYDFHADAKRVQ